MEKWAEMAAAEVHVEAGAIYDVLRAGGGAAFKGNARSTTDAQSLDQGLVAGGVLGLEVVQQVRRFTILSRPRWLLVSLMCSKCLPEICA